MTDALTSHSAVLYMPEGTNTAFALAKLCYETLLTDGLKAIHACDANQVTLDFENIIEANSLFSGLGFESGGSL